MRAVLSLEAQIFWSVSPVIVAAKRFPVNSVNSVVIAILIMSILELKRYIFIWTTLDSPSSKQHSLHSNASKSLKCHNQFKTTAMTFNPWLSHKRAQTLGRCE